MTSEIRVGSLGGNPSTDSLVRNLTVAASEITTLQANATLRGYDLTPSTVAATGSVQGDAAALALGFNLVTGADATKGVKLPTAVAGKRVVVKNNAAAILKVWPFSGDGINAIAVDGSFSMASLTSCTFECYDATTWYTVPLVAS